jgi:hypothetical protein
MLAVLVAGAALVGVAACGSTGTTGSGAAKTDQGTTQPAPKPEVKGATSPADTDPSTTTTGLPTPEAYKGFTYTDNSSKGTNSSFTNKNPQPLKWTAASVAALGVTNGAGEPTTPTTYKDLVTKYGAPDSVTVTSTGDVAAWGMHGSQADVQAMLDTSGNVTMIISALK